MKIKNPACLFLYCRNKWEGDVFLKKEIERDQYIYDLIRIANYTLLLGYDKFQQNYTGFTTFNACLQKSAPTLSMEYKYT